MISDEGPNAEAEIISNIMFRHAIDLLRHLILQPYWEHGTVLLPIRCRPLQYSCREGFQRVLRAQLQRIWTGTISKPPPIGKSKAIRRKKHSQQGIAGPTRLGSR